MNGQYSAIARSFGAEEYFGAGSFQCNGAANPLATDIVAQRGLPFTVAYSGTGIYTLQFSLATRPVRRAFFVDACLQSSLADFADFTITENSLHLPANRLVLQLQRAGVAQVPPVRASNAFVQFCFMGTNNTGA